MNYFSRVVLPPLEGALNDGAAMRNVQLKFVREDGGRIDQNLARSGKYYGQRSPWIASGSDTGRGPRARPWSGWNRALAWRQLNSMDGERQKEPRLFRAGASGMRKARAAEEGPNLKRQGSDGPRSVAQPKA